MKRQAHLISPLLIGLLIVLSNVAHPIARADAPNQVGLVVAFDDGSVITRCVEFDAQEITGYDALTGAGLNVVADLNGGLGAAICSIEGTGCSRDRCLTCDVPNYWGYWHLTGGSWAYSSVGSSIYKVEHGDVEGWSWGNRNAPPVVAFEEICADPPTDTPTPTNTPLPDAPPATANLWLDRESIPAGSCTTLRWDASQLRPDAVYLEGEQVDSSGSTQVCPPSTHSYELRVVAGADEQTRDVTLEVSAAQVTHTPTPRPTETSTPKPQSQGDQAAPSATPSPTHRPTETPTPGALRVGAAPTPTPSATAQPQQEIEASATPTLTPIVVAQADNAAGPTPTVESTSASRGKPVADNVAPASPPEERSAGRGALGFLALGSLGMLTFGAIFLALVGFLTYSLIRRR